MLDDDPELSVLLALQAAESGGADVPVESVSALHEAVLNNRLSYSHPWPEERIGDGGVNSPISEDGRYLATTWLANYLELWDIENDSQVWSLEFPEGTLVGDGLFFSQDGSSLIGGASLQGQATGGAKPDDQQPGLYVWDVPTGKVTLFLDVGPCGGSVTGFAKNADVALVRTVAPDASGACDWAATPELWLVDLADGEMTPLDEAPPGSPLVISADGRFVAWGDDFETHRCSIFALAVLCSTRLLMPSIRS